ncbi:hypothetical protein B4064_3695 [Caldibacillus thermoamylovorans]|nr:hypothetical protein B4064_3695 [Caldibacillus thermoamylovorans]
MAIANEVQRYYYILNRAIPFFYKENSTIAEFSLSSVLPS